MPRSRNNLQPGKEGGHLRHKKTMPVKYKLYQLKSKNASMKDKWAARAVMTGSLNLSGIADRIERNCTAKRSDVMAVLIELVEVMTDELQSSHSVNIDGLGSFRVALASKLADTKESFSEAKNIKTVRIRFRPAVSGFAPKGAHRKRALIEGVKLERMDPNSAKAAVPPAGTGA